MLLQLPDSCLLSVLQFCADDPRSLFSAARAHSRLHQAAAVAASSMSVLLQQQQQADSALLYLTNHGQYVSSISISLMPSDATISMRQLPQNLRRLESLQVRGLHVQLQPEDGFPGVLHAGMPLRQLQLDTCTLLDGEEGLAAALSLLPSLQNLTIEPPPPRDSMHSVRSPSNVAQLLPQLTYLNLIGCARFQDLDSLQGLTMLQDLRLRLQPAGTVRASALSSSAQLTHLEVLGQVTVDMLSSSSFEAALFAGMTQLQHVELKLCAVQGGVAGVTEVLSHLQHMQQLTYLCLMRSLRDAAPAAAYLALVASSKLQHLDISCCRLPGGVWQHVFPAGRQLPHLQSLDISGWMDGAGSLVLEAPEGSTLVSCCPGLRSLWMSHLKYSEGQVASLTGLSALQHLCLWPVNTPPFDGMGSVCQLTGLTLLRLSDPVGANSADSRLLWQLTQLRQLQYLYYAGRRDGQLKIKAWRVEVSG